MSSKAKKNSKRSESSRELALRSLKESMVDVKNETDFQDFGDDWIPDDFAEKLFDISWKYRKDPNHQQIATEIKKYLKEIAPEEEGPE